MNMTQRKIQSMIDDEGICDDIEFVECSRASEHRLIKAGDEEGMTAYGLACDPFVFHWLEHEGEREDKSEGKREHYWIESAWVEASDSQRWLDQVSQRWCGRKGAIKPPLHRLHSGALPKPSRLKALGTPFQCRVWRALLALRAGDALSYRDLAQRLDTRAVRAVATAVGKNPFAPIIPCHRIIRSDGGLGGYHWGERVKQWLLDIEACC